MAERSEAQTSVSSYQASPRPPALPDMGPDIHGGELGVIVWPLVIVIKSKQTHKQTNKKNTNGFVENLSKQCESTSSAEKHISIKPAGLFSGETVHFLKTIIGRIMLNWRSHSLLSEARLDSSRNSSEQVLFSTCERCPVPELLWSQFVLINLLLGASCCLQPLLHLFPLTADTFMIQPWEFSAGDAAPYLQAPSRLTFWGRVNATSVWGLGRQWGLLDLVCLPNRVRSGPKSCVYTEQPCYWASC